MTKTTQSIDYERVQAYTNAAQGLSLRPQANGAFSPAGFEDIAPTLDTIGSGETVAEKHTQEVKAHDEAYIKGINDQSLMGSGKGMEDYGRIRNSVDATTSNEQNLKVKNEKSEKERFHRLLRLLERIEYIDNRMSELEEEIAALDVILQAEAGAQNIWEFNGDKFGIERMDGEDDGAYQARVQDELAKKMLDENGNVKPQYADEPIAQRLSKMAEHKRLAGERSELTEEYKTTREEAVELRDNPELVQRESKVVGLQAERVTAREGALSARREMRSVEADDAIDEKENLERFADERADASDVPSEVETFMRGIAEAAQIENRPERLRIEQEFVESLSDEAKEYLSWLPDTEHLFEDSYFDALETQPKSEIALAAASQDPVSKFTPG